MQHGIVRAIGRELLVQETRVRGNAQIKARRGAAGVMGRLTSYARSMRSASGTFDDIDAAIGFRKTRGFPYELSHEFGATAKPGGAMAVPISPQAKAASQRGIGARQAFSGKRMAIVKSMGKAFLVEHLKRRSVLHYVLIKSLPERLNFRRTIFAGIPAISQAVTMGAAEGAGAA